MNKDIQKLIDDSKDKTYSKLSDKKLIQFDEFITKGWGIGGNTMGNNHYKNGTGIFGMSKEKTKQTKINGGKVSGRLAVENGTVKKAGQISAKSPKHPNNVLVKCKHCGKEATLPLNRRWHGDNCKHKK